MEYVVTLVHGTRLRFTAHATWILPESPFSQLLQERLGSAVQVYPFRWRGGNTVRDRVDGARDLSAHLIEVARDHPHARRFVIGHSHGGNVVVRALGLPGVADAVHGAVCLSTPFFAVSKRNLGPSIAGNLVVAAMVSVFSLRVLITFLNRTPGKAGGTTIVLTLVSAAILMLMTLSMNRDAKAWIAKSVARLREDVDLPTDLPTRVLVVRSTGDEASALLASVQFVGWLATRITRLASDLAGRLRSSFEGAEWYLGSGLLIGSFVVDRVLSSPSTPPWARTVTLGAAAVIVLPTVILMALLVVSFLLLGILLNSYGPGIALGAPFLDVSVEPVPPGFSIVYQLPPSRDDGLRHSATYQNGDAIYMVARWLVNTGGSVVRDP
jgi:hypothetical protein